MSIFADSAGKTATELAFRDPQPGDRFSEMMAFYVYVVGRKGDLVATLEGNPPCTFPDDGVLRWQSLDEFRRRFSYGSIEGYWIRFMDRGNNVDGWIDGAGR